MGVGRRDEMAVIQYSVIYYEDENSINPHLSEMFDSKEEADEYLKEMKNEYPDRIWEIRFER